MEKRKQKQKENEGKKKKAMPFFWKIPHYVPPHQNFRERHASKCWVAQFLKLALGALWIV